MSAATSQAAWDALRRENAELAAQVEVMRSALEVHEQLYVRGFINAGELIGVTNLKRRAALALPNTAAADILKRRDARTLLEMAERLEDYYAAGGAAVDAVKIIRKTANEVAVNKSLRSMTEADFNEAHGG